MKIKQALIIVGVVLLLIPIGSFGDYHLFGKASFFGYIIQNCWEAGLILGGFSFGYWYRSITKNNQEGKKEEDMEPKIMGGKYVL